MLHLDRPIDEIDLTRLDEPQATASVLARVAVTLGSTLELREVLRRLARIGYEASGARHCSLFLLDGRRLVPTVAIGPQPDASTWHAFRSMGPIDLDETQWGLLTRGRAIPLGDATDTPLIPRAWRERFRLGAVAFVPLMADGGPCGLMSVDWPEPRRFHADEVGVLDAIGTAAGVAVRNARLFEQTQRRARLQEALTRGAAALAAPDGADVIADRLVGAYSDLIGARLCVIALFDSDRSWFTTVASRGPRDLPGRVPMSEIPQRVVSEVWATWEREKVPIEFDRQPWFDGFLGGAAAGAGRYLLYPLTVENHSRGCVLLGFEADRDLDDEERSALAALADMAEAAVERAVVAERREQRMRRLDALYRVSAALTEGADAGAMVATLNSLLEDDRIEVRSVAFRDERLVSRLGAEQLTAREREVLSRRDDWSTVSNGVAVIPMYLGRRLFGVLRVRPTQLDYEERAFLEALARDLAEVAHRDDLRVQVEEAARDGAVSAERERMSLDLHDTAGQVFVAMGLLARSHVEGVEPSDPNRSIIERLADLADKGKWEIDQASRALAFVPEARRGLVRSLRELARDVESDSGIRITVSVTEDIGSLDPSVERALFRVAHEAVANAWRHSGCSAISIEAELGEKAVVRVIDDGIGLEPETGTGTGLRSMRRAVEECGGTLWVAAGEDGGTVIEARAPGRDE